MYIYLFIYLFKAEKIQLAKIYIPWAIQASYRSSDLLSYEYEENLELPLEIVRKTLNIQPISDYLKIN
jgi:ubiquinone biosynthesis protein Coq4